MRHGPLPAESWHWPICAVSRDVEREYGMGAWLFVESVGFRRVSDRTAGWVTDTVDIRWPVRRMECWRARVWVIWKGDD